MRTSVSGSGKLKQRRAEAACDVCRRRKTRCDGPTMPDEICSFCLAHNLHCTYIDKAARRARNPPKEYVRSLEKRIDQLQQIIQKLCPDKDLLKELEATLEGDQQGPSQASSSQALTSLNPRISRSHSSSGDDELDPSDDDFIPLRPDSLADWLESLQLNPVKPRFVGKSGGHRLVLAAVTRKTELTGDTKLTVMNRFLAACRPEFWRTSPWEDLAMRHGSSEAQKIFQFPEPDLLAVLVSKYFDEVNSMLPLLIRPAFERDIASGLHYRDQGFGSVLLLVCAVSSRYVCDPRVWVEGDTNGASSGWKYFNQVEMIRKAVFAPPRLADIQVCALAVIFLAGSSTPHAIWTMIGYGLRMAQDIGLNRRKTYGSAPTLYDELLKRAFWILVMDDANISSALGRPTAMHEEDIDVDMPLECDDEYWMSVSISDTTPLVNIRSAGDTYFGQMIRLHRILSFAMRTVFSLENEKRASGSKQKEQELKMVGQVDSALNKWLSEMPLHLKWDPEQQDISLLHHSAMLHTQYYLVQITVHRPFMESPDKALSLPAIAICTNAARSCARIVDIEQRRSNVPLPYQLRPAFTAGVLLLLNIWGRRRAGANVDFSEELKDVDKCLNILKHCEPAWSCAGRFRDILGDLASLNLAQQLPALSEGQTSTSDGSSPAMMNSDIMDVLANLPVPPIKAADPGDVTSFSPGLAHDVQDEHMLPPIYPSSTPGAKDNLSQILTEPLPDMMLYESMMNDLTDMWTSIPFGSNGLPEWDIYQSAVPESGQYPNLY